MDTMLELTFAREKTTPNMVRFKEVPPTGQPQKVGTLYVQKWAADVIGNPEQVTVTITAGA